MAEIKLTFCVGLFFTEKLCIFPVKINWCNNLVTLMNAGDLANTVAEAEEQLQAHLERKVSCLNIRSPHLLKESNIIMRKIVDSVKYAK